MSAASAIISKVQAFLAPDPASRCAPKYITQALINVALLNSVTLLFYEPLRVDTGTESVASVVDLLDVDDIFDSQPLADLFWGEYVDLVGMEFYFFLQDLQEMPLPEQPLIRRLHLASLLDKAMGSGSSLQPVTTHGLGR